MAEDLKSAEAQAEQDYENLQAVFIARAIYRQALERKNQAEHKAGCVAPPEGYLFKITARSEGSLTRVHDGHKPNPWYQDLEEGQIVYAPRIDSTRRDGYTTSTFTSWLNGPLGQAFSLDRHEPVIINSGDFDLGLISLEEYTERRLAGDMSLYRTTSESIATS